MALGSGLASKIRSHTGDYVAETDIFISYSREDRKAARHFADSFASEGFTVWWDAALRSGQTFDEVIEKQLRAAKAVVVLWSPRSVASRWVRAEATMADRRNKLVPAIIQACDLPIIFELTHAADLADWTGDTTDPRWRTLVDDIRGLVGEGEAAAAAEAVAATERAAAEAAAAVERAAANAVPVAANPPAAAVRKPAESEFSGGKPLAPGSIDELMAAAARLRESRAGAKLRKPTPEEAERDRFFKRVDEFDSSERDTIHYLQILDGRDSESRYAVGPSGLTIGRTAPADIIIPGAGISRAHCMVELAGDDVRVTDLNSTNGTHIDNKRINRSAILPVGSILRVGGVSLEHATRSRAELEVERSAIHLDDGQEARMPRLARSS